MNLRRPTIMMLPAEVLAGLVGATAAQGPGVLVSQILRLHEISALLR